ncbi:MAG TPA: hypothetical protein VG734_25020 [Lacunisphaera sp.]|nr:hypothetical protein [Lacunisphaera sp.]
MKSAALLLSTALLATAASAKVTEKFSQTYPLDANGTIRVENVNGTVEIVAWDKAEVSLEAEKSARTEEGLQRMQIKIDATNRRLAVKTEMEKKWKFWDNMNAQVHYKLMVPAGVSLERIDVVNANIEVTDVKGDVNLSTVNGGVDARGLAGAGHFESVNGSLRVAYAALPASGNIGLETVNGSCKLLVPPGAAFDLSAETVNGHISCDFPITLQKSGRRELRGPVNGGGPRVSLESVNGGLSVEKAK